MAVKVQNWKHSLTYSAHSVETVTSAEQIISIVEDCSRYPPPVRVKGSHHSTTHCIEAEAGTVIDVTKMNRILRIDSQELIITMQAGVRHIDAAKALEKLGLQFYVNVEIGNLTVGSGACGGTKDASYISGGKTEFGQVASYCIGMKVVQADGTLLEITEQESELLEMMRSSYGMLGVIYEVTYRVKPIRPMAVTHVKYSVEEFAANLDQILAQPRSIMLYLFPFLNRVVVEYRQDAPGPLQSGSWQWRLRNWVWKTGSPGLARAIGYLPGEALKNCLYNLWNLFSMWVMVTVLRDCNSSPADQIILYPESAGFASYTFSIWAFEQQRYGQALLDYFRFCRDYYRQRGYRCDLLNVGYRIAQDRQSNFSYSRQGPVLTLDPVATGGEGWYEFLDAYNEFCHAHHGKPLFNQTWGITAPQTRAAFADEIAAFQSLRRERDPLGRFYTAWFRQLLDNDNPEL